MRRLPLVALALIALPATLVSAQRPVQVLVAGGASAPQGDVSDVAGIGWHFLGALNVSSLMVPLGLRLEGAFHRLGGNDVTIGDISVISVTGNLSYRWPMTNSTFSPYLIGGIGSYTTECESAGCGSSTNFGWNAGLGTKLYLLGFRSFLEARYHSTARDQGSVRYLPLSFGITF